MPLVQTIARLPITLWQFAYHGVSRIGERVGSDALTYNWGVTLSFHRAANRNRAKWADAILDEFPRLRSVADIGCGSGAYLAEFQRRGLRVIGCEYGARARRWAAKQGVKVVPFDLSKSFDPLPGAPYDLAMSVEVAEHVPPALADEMVRFVTSASALVAFTAAKPGQAGGIGHINEQEKPYWIERFISAGFEFDEATTNRLAKRLRESDAAHFLHENLMVFRRRRQPSVPANNS